MKPRHLAPFVLVSLLITACDRQSPEAAKRIAELERQANEATSKQRELEARLAEQQIAAERDAIERERMRLEEDRIEMERQQGEAAAAEAERIRQRETDLATREGRLMRLESELDDKQDDLDQRGEELGERERELAGREALASADESPAPAAEPVGDFGMFYDSLSPYGSWFETPDYGYVWQPVVVRDSGWRPYTRGRWVCTDRGWTWVSDEPFGWACYHYGRWALCRSYGWVWVPGTEWAPAWVCWRSGGSHIGWAPLPPETLAWRGPRWDSSVELTFGIGSLWFNFVETRNFCHPIHHYCLPYTQNDVYIGQTVNITNIHVHNRRVICGGPRYSDVAVQTKRRPPFYRIEEDRHGRHARDLTAMRPRVEGNRLHVAAPNLNADWNDALRPNRIKGRIDQLQIERKESLRPEVAERFRQSREESRRKSEETINRLGGREALQQARAEQQRTNRTQETRGIATTGDKPRSVAPRDDMSRPGTNPEVTERVLESGMRPAGPRPEATPTVRQPETARRDEPATPARPGTATPIRPVAPRDDMRRPGNNPELVERLRESGMRPGLPPASTNRPKQNESASNPTKEPRVTPPPRQDDRAEAQRQQQAELARQREQQERARQQQEQMERQREQQERARQQQEQMERQREQQERARRQQEQIERQREQQERARQQQEQMERQREQQERARQQQEQAERQREQQERARQQQEQQERSRQQERDEEQRRGRNR